MGFSASQWIKNIPLNLDEGISEKGGICEGGACKNVAAAVDLTAAASSCVGC